MKTTTEKMENCQVALNVEMEDVETQKYMSIALDHLSKRVTLPGFRKGKAPISLVEQHIGKEALLQEALEHLVPEAYEEALKSEEITAIAEPSIELVQINPIIFKAVVPTKPQVTPGNYRDIKLEIGKKEVSESDISQVIEQLQLQFGTLVAVEREIIFGDVISADIEGKRGDESILSRKDALYEVNQGAKYPVPGFAEEVIGLKTGDEKSFEIAFPDDYEIKEIAGKQYSFTISIKEVKEKNLPEINDEFAKNAGSESVDELKENIRTGLQVRADESLKKEFEHRLITSLIEQSVIDYPPVLVEKEIDHIISEESRNFPDREKGLESYLSHANKTMEQHRDDLKPAATDRVKAYLVTVRIAELENITAGDDEVTEAIENMVKGEPDKADNIRNLFKMQQPRDSLRDMIIVNKTMDFLTKLVTGQQN